MERNFFKTMSSPLGNIVIKASEIGITSVQFDDDHWEDNPTPQLLYCEEQLQEYFDGKRENFDIPLDFSGYSDFYQSVWNVLLKIPFGTTCSYLDIAKSLNNINAIRAVGGANGANPIAIIVPCHRVIGSDGSLTGYAGGLHRKRKLLALENPICFAEQGSLF